MKIAVALAIAYLIGAIAYVVGEIGEPVIRKPAYAREYRQRGRLGPVIAVARRRWGVILLFVIVAAIGEAVVR